MSRSEKILELRALIQRHLSAPPAANRAYLETGIPSLDGLLEGGLWKGGIVEITSPARTSGVTSLMLKILSHAANQGRWSALIDGSDSFDPQSAEREVRAHLLWIRCQKATEALQSADLLLRDGNLPLLVLDLRGHRAATLRQIAESRWYRLQRAIEPTSVALLALTSQPLVKSADVRLTVCSHFNLEALEREPQELLGELSLELTRKRASSRSESLLAQAS